MEGTDSYFTWRSKMAFYQSVDIIASNDDVIDKG